MDERAIVIDGREFVHNRMTGIGRFLKGLIDALAEADFAKNIVVALFNKAAAPEEIRCRENVSLLEAPKGFIASEKFLSVLSRRKPAVYVSPYPKLPLFGCRCPSVHTVHDILYLTHPAYQKRPGILFDRFRLKSALKNASLTWYVSAWSMHETHERFGRSGRSPKVRANVLDSVFAPLDGGYVRQTLARYRLKPGYILTVGNGMPHKNLGTLLSIVPRLRREIVFVGVSCANRQYWQKRFPEADCRWIEYVPEYDLAVVINGSFCLALPSTAEGYGYPPLEAMACGRPAIVSDIPVLKETTGGFALSAAPHRQREWIDAIRALEQKEIYNQQVEKGLRWASARQGRKGWHKHIADIETLIRQARAF